MPKKTTTAQKYVKSAVKRAKKGTLKSGKSGKAVKSRKQAIAIGLSEARREGGAKIPKKKTARKKTVGKKTVDRKTVGKKTVRKKTAKKSSSKK